MCHVEYVYVILRSRHYRLLQKLMTKLAETARILRIISKEFPPVRGVRDMATDASKGLSLTVRVPASGKRVGLRRRTEHHMRLLVDATMALQANLIAGLFQE